MKYNKETGKLDMSNLEAVFLVFIPMALGWIAYAAIFTKCVKWVYWFYVGLFS